MLIFLYLVFLCSNFLFIKSEVFVVIAATEICENFNCLAITVHKIQPGDSQIDDNVNVRIDVIPGMDCTLGNNYTFTEGQKITLFVKPSRFINHGWWRVTNGAETRNIFNEISSGKGTDQQENSEREDKPPEPTKLTQVIDKSMQGKWEFTFYLLKDNENSYQVNPNARAQFLDEHGILHNYTTSTCSTNVKIEPAVNPPAAAAKTSKNPNYTVIIACVVGAVLVAIIVAQAAYIMFLKAKAQKLITLNTHNNLSKKSDAAPADTARYCSNPGQKMMKVATPVDDDNNRDSAIYEAPNIEISSNARMPMQPPQPPAINTIPRTPRQDHNMRINHQAMLSSALNSPPNFQKPNHNDVSNRPRLPLPITLHDTPHTIPKYNPHDHMFHEVYEEMDHDPMEENTYEPPPVINAMPPRLPMPPKKVPTGNLLDVKENTLTRPGNRPPVTPKPTRPRSNTMIPPNELEQALRKRNDTMPKPTMTPMQQELTMRRRPIGDSQPNELEEALRRRNNAVKHVPIVSIPDPSSKESPKPRPAPPSKMKGQPIPNPVQEEIYYNENQASSDEEWTYEPLKPLNKVMQAPIMSNPDPASSESLKPRPPLSKPWGPPTTQPHPVQDGPPGPPQSKPRGPPIPHPVQEEIYYNENQASSDEEWIYEPLKPAHNYECNS